jgi:hypothetical protein
MKTQATIGTAARPVLALLILTAIRGWSAQAAGCVPQKLAGLPPSIRVSLPKNDCRRGVIIPQRPGNSYAAGYLVNVETDGRLTVEGQGVWLYLCIPDGKNRCGPIVKDGPVRIDAPVRRLTYLLVAANKGESPQEGTFPLTITFVPTQCPSQRIGLPFVENSRPRLTCPGPDGRVARIYSFAAEPGDRFTIDNLDVAEAVNVSVVVRGPDGKLLFRDPQNPTPTYRVAAQGEHSISVRAQKMNAAGAGPPYIRALRVSRLPEVKPIVPRSATGKHDVFETAEPPPPVPIPARIVKIPPREPPVGPTRPPKVAVPIPPTLTCAAEPSTVAPGEPVRLTATAATTSGGTLTYAWVNRGIAGRVEGTGPRARLDTTGVAPGTYWVTVRVDDGRGGFADCTLRVTVKAPPAERPIEPPTWEDIVSGVRQLVAQNQFDRAIEELMKAREQFSGEPTFYFFLGYADFHKGGQYSLSSAERQAAYTTAKSALQEFLKKTPDDPLGVEARELLGKIRADSFDTFVTSVLQLIREKQFDRAVDELVKAQDEFSDVPRFYYYVGYVYLHKGGQYGRFSKEKLSAYVTARNRFQEFLRKAPDDPLGVEARRLLRELNASLRR